MSACAEQALEVLGAAPVLLGDLEKMIVCFR